MTLKLDKAGRIVLPKRIRDRLRLKPGSDLTIEERAEGVLLRAVSPQPASLIQRKGLLVHRGEAPHALDWDRLVEDEREERIAGVHRL